MTSWTFLEPTFENLTDFQQLIERHVQDPYKSSYLYKLFFQSPRLDCYHSDRALVFVQNKNLPFTSYIFSYEVCTNKSIEEFYQYYGLNHKDTKTFLFGESDDRSLEKFHFGVLDLNSFEFDFLSRQLKTHLKKINPSKVVTRFENYSPERWIEDIKGLKKFYAFKGLPLGFPIILQDIFPVGVPENLERSVVEYETQIQHGIISKWNKIWSADHHWNFNQFQSKINLTTLFHYTQIERAKALGIEHYNLGVMIGNDPGLQRYKGLWKPRLKPYYSLKGLIY